MNVNMAMGPQAEGRGFKRKGSPPWFTYQRGKRERLIGGVASLKIDWDSESHKKILVFKILRVSSFATGPFLHFCHGHWNFHFWGWWRKSTFFNMSSKSQRVPISYLCTDARPNCGLWSLESGNIRLEAEWRSKIFKLSYKTFLQRIKYFWKIHFMYELSTI